MPPRGDPPTDSLSRRTLADQIVERLRRDILFGEIAGDERLTQESLCQRFNTSRIPVRDAIQRLMHDGLMEVIPNGLRVVTPTRQDLDDMFLIEGQLHGLACQLMTSRATPEELQDLVRINNEMHVAFDDQDFERVAEVNGRFHRKINKLAKSPQLLRALRANSARIDSDFLAHFPHRTKGALDQHDRFIEAALAGDAELTASIMREHVAGSSELLRDVSLDVLAARTRSA